MEPSYPPVRSGSSRGLAVKVLGLLIGAAIAIAGLSLLVANTAPDSLINRLNAYLLPADLSDAFFLYERNNADSNTVYRLVDGMYEAVNLGTTLPTVYLSRRGTHTASIQIGEQQVYEVRADAALIYSSEALKTSAAVSPNGLRVAIAESDQATIEVAHAANAARFASSILLVEKGSTEPKMLGDGYAPFFITDDEVAWFSNAGLVKHDLRTGTTTVLAERVRPLPPPYTPPSVSRDGHLIAWTTPETSTIHVEIVTAEGVTPAMDFVGAKGPNVSLGNDTLFVLEHAEKGTTVWRYGLTPGSEPTRVPGLLSAGRIIQLVP